MSCLFRLKMMFVERDTDGQYAEYNFVWETKPVLFICVKEWTFLYGRDYNRQYSYFHLVLGVCDDEKRKRCICELKMYDNNMWREKEEEDFCVISQFHIPYMYCMYVCMSKCKMLAMESVQHMRVKANCFQRQDMTWWAPPSLLTWHTVVHTNTHTQNTGEL